MVLLDNVMDEIDNYLKTDMEKDLKKFEKRNGYAVFNQTKALAEAAISDEKPLNYEDFLKLRQVYNCKDFPEFRKLVDKVLDHLKEVYKDEEIKLYNGQIVKGSNYFDFAKYSLRMAKDKEFANVTKSNVRKNLEFNIKEAEETEEAPVEQTEEVEEVKEPVQLEKALNVKKEDEETL